ncbi:MAG TPA: DUF2089 family protein [Gammaproteobacteria bacterium]
MLHCTVCSGLLQVREMVCPACEVHVSGEFRFPRLLRLSAKHLALAEALVLSGGNLKAMAQSLDISYPTLRKRVDELIAELHKLRDEDQRRIDEILRDIEAGKISAEKGTRMIRELNGAA